MWLASAARRRGATLAMAGSRNSGLRLSTQYSSVRSASATSSSRPSRASTSGLIRRGSPASCSLSLQYQEPHHLLTAFSDRYLTGCLVPLSKHLLKANRRSLCLACIVGAVSPTDSVYGQGTSQLAQALSSHLTKVTEGQSS